MLHALSRDAPSQDSPIKWKHLGAQDSVENMPNHDNEKGHHCFIAVGECAGAQVNRPDCSQIENWGSMWLVLM